jgi:hypothetical protein
LTGIPGPIKERWCYGMICRSLSNILTENDAILTEIPLERRNSKGRVDFIFTYRRWIYLIELKVGISNLNSNVNNNNRILRLWKNDRNGVVDQLDQIYKNNNSINKIKEIFDCTSLSNRKALRGIRFLPIVVVCHQIATKKGIEHLNRMIEKISNEGIKKHHNQISHAYENCSYSYYNSENYYINNRRNQKGLRVNMGLSIFAGFNEFEEKEFKKAPRLAQKSPRP